MFSTLASIWDRSAFPSLRDTTFFLGPLLGGTLASLATERQVFTWYAYLSKPSITPSRWVVKPVWQALYILMGYAGKLAFKDGIRQHPYAFAYFERPDQAMYIWLGQFGCLCASYKSIRQYHPPAAGLLLPIIAWVAIAGAFNASIALKNPPKEPPFLGLNNMK
eukprot:gene10564-2688_t